MRGTLILICLVLPLLLTAGTLNLNLPLVPNAFSEEAISAAGYGWQTAPGTLRLPTRTVNILIPPGAEVLSWNAALGSPISMEGPAPQVNPAFSDGERLLDSSPRTNQAAGIVYQGLGRWGDLRYASFRVMPATWDAASSRWNWSGDLAVNLSYSEPVKASGALPPTFKHLQAKGSAFFANSQDLDKWYSPNSTKFYDILYVGTPELYAAVSALEAFRNTQGFITNFANIATILNTTAGTNPANRLRNYLVNEYAAHPFTYLVLLGDYDTVPVAMLTPEPNGMELVPSDFFYGDLSSVIDTDGDERLGEYSSGAGDQDWGVDFTPEVFVGRFSTNSASEIQSIAARIVAYEQSQAAWKNKALLPAAFLNYQNEPENGFLQTDGAGFMEYARSTILSGMQTTTMYEQIGVVPSYPSDLNLDYDILKNTLSSQSFGLLSWSAHGSATSSSRKVWVNDDNANDYPDSWEMEWMNMVNRTSFNNLVNQDGMVIFMASCYNGQIDHTSASLAEYALIKKGVAVFGATRTGWYKIGWLNPGWGGLSSYNYHLLENYVPHQMSVGAAAAYANLIHAQYYMFGDPVDSGGIIWPELQNVYTYLLYGDPAVGHTGAQTPPQGEILVWEPTGTDAPAIVNALHQMGRWNVVHTDKLIPDYDYINRFEAVFALFGRGDTAYNLVPGSLEYNMLNSYLNNGGRLYLEARGVWNPSEPFWGKFGAAISPEELVQIEAIAYHGGNYVWQYDQTDPAADAMSAYHSYARPMFFTANPNQNSVYIGIWGSNGVYRTVASSFQLGKILDGTPGLTEMLQVICDTLNVGESAAWVDNDDPITPQLISALRSWPNPFKSSVNISLELKNPAEVKLDVFNIRGQKLRTISLPAASGIREISWDGRDSAGLPCPTGVYLIRAQGSANTQTIKVLMIK